MRGTGGTGSFIKLDEVNGASRKRRIPTLKMGLMLMRRKNLHPVDLFGGLHSTYGLGAGQKMTVEKKMNILAGDCGAEETEQQD